MPNGPPAPTRTRKPTTDNRKPSSLLDSDFVRKLELLEIIFRRNVVGRREGDRPGVARGGRIEFADYREYAPGDDLRYIDWNVYARTDRLFVKEFTKQEAVLVCVLVDASASMAFGEPRKLDYAKRLAAALAYLALAGKNEAQLGAFADGDVRWSPRFAGRPDIRSLAAFLDPLEARGATSVLGALRGLSDRVAERSLVILLSDLLEDGDGRRGLRLLGSRRFDLAVLHLLSPQELRPPAVGAVRLADAESNLTDDLTVDDAALRLYADRLNAFCEGWRTFCERHDIRYTETSTATPFEECVLAYLRRGGLVR